MPADFPGAWEIDPGGSKRQAIEGAPAAHRLINTWIRWDSGWYLEIAKHGYSFERGTPSSCAFFPLYPLLIAGLRHLLFLPGSDYGYATAALLVSNTALLAALIYFQKLIELDWRSSTARSACLYLLTFPTTFFLSAAYTESLLVASTIAAFYYARLSRWLIACLLASLATASRPQGLLVGAALLIEYFAQTNWRLSRMRSDLLGFLFVPVPLLAFIFYLQQRFGGWRVLFEAQQPWGRKLMWPWDTWRWLLHTVTTGAAAGHDFIDFVFFLLLIAAGVAGLRILPLSYAVFSWLNIIFISSWGMLGSAPRFDLVVFPLFIVLAVSTNSSAVAKIAVPALFAVAAAYLMILYSQWHWVA